MFKLFVGGEGGWGPGSTFKLSGGFRVPSPRIPMFRVLGSLSQFYTMPFNRYNLFSKCNLKLAAKELDSHVTP